ncbi:MAG: hypothetical protein ACI4R9_02895 [Kiritimatiellia bacterium]
MKALFDRLHARLGDFWWYSLMIFVACRAGDAIQAFIGLWLVPKYVGSAELGAVLPLQQLSGLFTVPIAVLATVFAKYVNVYATRGEFGKVKCLVRDVLVAAAALFAVCIAAAYLVVPFFYTRLRVVSGSLTALVLAAGFAGNVASLFTSALQGLKMFKAITVQNLISAPIRLVTLLVAMPVRALSGYILGQTTPSAACSFLAFGSLRRRLAPHPCDTSWRKDLPEIGRYLWPYAVCTLVGTFAGTLTATVYRQRLPEIESAAYYMLTRFSDIAGFAAATVGVILFPLASEAHERGGENRRLMWHSIFATLGGSLLLAVVFAFAAAPVFSLTETWRPYLPYVHLLPVLTISLGIGLSSGIVANYELACNRLGATILLAAANLATAALLVALTGCEFFRGLLPDAFVDRLVALNVARLSVLTYLSLATGLLLLAVLLAWTRCAPGARREARR